MSNFLCGFVIVGSSGRFALQSSGSITQIAALGAKGGFREIGKAKLCTIKCLEWAGRDHDPARQWDCHLNATSTRIRRFGAVGDSESRSMSGAAGMGNARNQRLGVQVTEIHKLLESLEFWLIT